MRMDRWMDDRISRLLMLMQMLRRVFSSQNQS